MDSDAVLLQHLKNSSFGGEWATPPRWRGGVAGREVAGIIKGTSSAATVNVPSSRALSDSQDKAEDTERQPRGLVRDM